jgi:hypothetical protein
MKTKRNTKNPWSKCRKCDRNHHCRLTPQKCKKFTLKRDPLIRMNSFDMNNHNMLLRVGEAK